MSNEIDIQQYFFAFTFQGHRSRAAGSSKNVAGNLQIKQRPSKEAPITIEGWLFKQGVDGLKFWKKRWFVLSEFVLYYHKSPDDGLPSGSIPLPSYKISPASKEDGIGKKFAFKAEHKNMRTYYFAAESKDLMIQWMNAMSLATIGEQQQDFSKFSNSKSSPGDSQRILLQNFNHQVHNHPPAVHQMFSPNGNAYLYHPPANQNASGMLSPSGGSGMQPLYANAPPKPRRLNTSRDPSPTGEVHLQRKGSFVGDEHAQQLTPGMATSGGGYLSPQSNLPQGQTEQIMVTGRYHHPMNEVHQVQYTVLHRLEHPP